MAKKHTGLRSEVERLKEQNNVLQQKLWEAKESFYAIQTGNIDALVVANKNDLKVYTKKTADKIYRILIEKMHEGAIALKEDGAVLYCNSYFAGMVGLPLKKVIGAAFSSFIKDSSKGRFEGLLKEGRLGFSQDEVYINTENGKYMPVLLSVDTLQVDNTFVLSIILTDLTLQNKNQDELERRAGELEEKNKELENANKDLTSFNYISGHDLQEPLRKIKNFVGVLLDEEKDNLSADGKKYLQKTHETAHRMQSLIEDLLTYSRANSSERKLEKMNLNHIVSEVKKDYEEAMHETKTTIETAFLCEADIIPFQFRQLIGNLLSNSLKFAKTRTALKVKITGGPIKGSELKNGKPALFAGSISPKKDYCHITYTDNGIGFDPQYNERIFEVFQRLYSKEEYPGTGIGLAICKRIVENHDGHITAIGKLGKGARFDIYIPAA